MLALGLNVSTEDLESQLFSDIKKNRIQTYTDQDLTFVVPKGGVECFGIETEQLEDVDQGFTSYSAIHLTVSCSDPGPVHP